MDFKEANKEAYEQIADDYSKANLKPVWTKEFEAFLSLLPGKQVIDIGCGTGRDAALMVKAGIQYIGVDASEAMLTIARRDVPSGTFMCMDFDHLDFGDQIFDGFWAMASFLHTPKAQLPEVLREAKRILKPGGVGFITLKEKKEVGEEVIHEERFGKTISRFFAFYTEDEFKNYLTEVGFEIMDGMPHKDADDRGVMWLGFLVRKP